MAARPGPKPLPVSARFWMRVVKTGECWEWTGSQDVHGYGQINLGQPRKLMLTHRLSWQFANGPIPEGMKILHKCDNPRCVRPDHLFIGTMADNTRDMMNKHRHHSHNHTNYMPRGKDHHYYNAGPKLTRKIAEKIRKSDEPQYVLAKKYGVHQSLISMIKSGKIWK